MLLHTSARIPNTSIGNHRSQILPSPHPPRSRRNALAALFRDFKPNLHLGCAPGSSCCLRGATTCMGSGLGATGVPCSPALPRRLRHHHAIVHPSVMENRGFPTSPAGESPRLLHGFISPFPACKPGPTEECDPLLPIVPCSEGTIVISRHCSWWGMNHPLSRRERSPHRPAPRCWTRFCAINSFQCSSPSPAKLNPPFAACPASGIRRHLPAGQQSDVPMQLGWRRGESAGGAEISRIGVTSAS